jgi:diguanylate cyclase (GGDEF)-like protein
LGAAFGMDIGAVTIILAVAMTAITAVLALVWQRSIVIQNDVQNLTHWVGNWDIDGALHIAPLVQSEQVNDLKNNFQNMAERISTTMEVMQDLAHKDPLTGLPNRTHFEGIVQSHLKANSKDATQSCLIFLDIDGFKGVNDTLGHHMGDQLIRIVGDRLRLSSRLDGLISGEPQMPKRKGDNGVVARLGGDEFTVFLPEIASADVAMQIASRILRVMAEPFELGAQATAVSASIGIAMAPRDGTSYFELLRAADTAMYQAKRSGRNCAALYDSSLDEELRQLIQSEKDLRKALAANQFELLFQPQYDCRTLKITSAEALIRWRHPTRGLVMPSDFIGLAEKLNLINQIGEWVIWEAVARIAKLNDDGLPLRISVNVSPHQMQQIDFVSSVKAALSQFNAPPRLLELELTESVAMQNVDMVSERLLRIHDIGVSIAIDDFGVGYSNLASLIRLPLSRLKLDRSLSQNLVERPEARTLVQTIISMANGLGFHSVAEGVETKAQLDLLNVMGCDVVQGFLLSQPVDELALRRLIPEPNSIASHSMMDALSHEHIAQKIGKS